MYQSLFMLLTLRLADGLCEDHMPIGCKIDFSEDCISESTECFSLLWSISYF